MTSSRQVRQWAVEAVTEYLERVAQLKVTGVLDKFGKQARFLGSFITKVHGGYTIQKTQKRCWPDCET